MEELEIVNRIWNRSEDALQLLAQQYSLFCRKIAFNCLSDEADVEEILNDVWLGVWNSIPPNRPDNLSSYLAKITRNLSCNKYRNMHAKKRVNPEAVTVFEELEQCTAAKGDPAESIEAKELAGYIEDFLSSLSEMDRAAFIRRYWFFDSVSSTSDYLYCSEGNAKVRLWRTRNKLRHFLESKGVII